MGSIDKAKITAVVISMSLLNGGVGLAIGTAATESRMTAKVTEATNDAFLANEERDSEFARAARYEKAYLAAQNEISGLKRLLAEARNPADNTVLEVMDSGNDTALSLETPDPSIYAEEFGWDYDYVVRTVGAECRGEPFEGIIAVAQCIQDAADLTGMTPEEVVKSPEYGYAKPVGHDILDGMEEVNEACLQVFAKGAKVTNEQIEFFYSTRNNGYSEWHEEHTRFVMEIGDHRFFTRA